MAQVLPSSVFVQSGFCSLAQGRLENTGNNFFVFHVVINCETNSVKCVNLFLFLNVEKRFVR